MVSSGSFVELAGKVTWKDQNGKVHPVRGAMVEIWDANKIFEDKLLTTVRTNAFGEYGKDEKIVFDNNDSLDGRRDVYLKVFANGITYFVKSPETSGMIYWQKNAPTLEIPDGANTINFEIDNQYDSERAFSVNDALYVGAIYSSWIRGITLAVSVSFPSPRDISDYTLSNRQINITQDKRWAWDEILHEYGHFLADLDGLAKFPGGHHSPGVSNIKLGQKVAGIQLGWSEGLADYLSIAIQAVARSLNPSALPDVPTVGDSFYQAFNADNSDPNIQIRFDLETKEGSANQGEGDEVSVARILWDIADDNQDTFDSGLKDTVALGHKQLYDILNTSIPNLDQLDNVWNYFFDLYAISNPAELVKFGAIFEEYGVSPIPEGDLTNKILLGAAPPKITWQPGNNNENDDFQVIIFNNDFSKRVLESLSLNGTTTEWTPSEAEWGSIISNPGIYHLVVTGSDTTQGTTDSNTNYILTGPYWSGARSFTVVNPANLGPNQALAQLEQILTKLQSGINDQVLNSSTFQSSGLPLLDNLFTSADNPSTLQEVDSTGSQGIGGGSQSFASQSTLLNGSQFIQGFANQLQAKFTEEFPLGLSSILEIQQVLSELFESQLNFAIDGSQLKVNVPIQGTNTFEVPLQQQLGLPQLGINIPAGAKSSVDLNYAFNLGFSIDLLTNEVFFDIAPQQDVHFSLTPKFETEATIGSLKFKVQDEGSQFNFNVDWQDGNDNQLTVDELNNLLTLPKGDAVIKLKFTADSGQSFDVKLNFADLFADSQPKLTVNNQDLDFGSFLPTITQLILGQTGSDTITSPIDYRLADDQKNLTLAGNDPISGTGNSLDNAITGNGANNSLYGEAGNDTLDGGSGDDLLDGGIGDDVMSGGFGNDTFIVDNRSDSIIEEINGGNDTVRASTNYILSDNLEDLILEGNEKINGTGNSLNNHLTGNVDQNYLYAEDGDDLVDGNTGDDYLYGQAGNDSLLGGTGKDWLIGGAGDDSLRSGKSRDHLLGGVGNDSLFGGRGRDWLTGGAGADNFELRLLKRSSDVITDFKILDGDRLVIVAKGAAKDLKVGNLPAEQFVLGAGAESESNRVIYNPATGRLFFDADGTGDRTQVLLATLSKGLDLTHRSISVMA